MKTPDGCSRSSALIHPLLALLVCLFGIQARAIDSSAVKKLFANPPREYSTGPLWVWNDLLTEREIRDTMRDLASQKVKQVFVHPRPGLMTPYLSKDWFRLWKVALDEAKQLDMNVWIYDENSYPSGFAGGLVPEAMPESRGRGLILKEAKSPPPWADNLIVVYRVEGDVSENVTAKIKAGEALPEARYLVASEARAANSPWHGNRSYVNLLSPGVTEKFLDITMEAYRREIGDQFGQRVPGVFTDEPNIRPAGGLPWSEILPQEFQKRWGYNLLDHLPSLTQPIGDWRKIRHNYYQVLNEQFIEHWSKPYHDYCEKHGLEWTGHYWDHEWPNCVGVPDNMAMYAWHQRPAIDSLMNQYAENTHAQFGNARMVRELSSVANQLGQKRTLCEVYGAGGWDLRFEDMKRIGDWLAVLGVNTFDEHLSYVTIRGARKRDHPQSFSYHEPWWEAYHVSAGYFARLSAALSQGQQINRVLIIEPTTTAWMYQGDQARLKEIGDSFFQFLMTLEAAQVEYDLGSEDVIARHGAVEGQELRVGKRRYHTVVLPPMMNPLSTLTPPVKLNLNRRTMTLLHDFVVARGSVLDCAKGVECIDGQRADAAHFPELQVMLNQSWKRVEPAALPEMLLASTKADGFAITRKPEDKGILFHMRRQLDDGELLFLVNTSIESPTAGTIESRGKGIEQLDLETGTTKPFAFRVDKDGVRSVFNLPPCGSLLLFLSNKPRPPKPEIAAHATMIAASGSPEIQRVEPNVLTLDYVDITAGGETQTNVYFYQANRFAFYKNGMERNPWDSAVQFRDELIKRTFPADSGFTANYRFMIQEKVPASLFIVIERPDLYGISCNGKRISAKKDAWWLDKSFGRIDLASAARVGENVVTIKASPFTIWHELEPAYVLGDFTLKAVENGFVITPESVLHLGRWNDQGHPFYSAGVGYREQFKVDALANKYFVTLSDWYGSVAKVLVNGKPAGYITHAPWQCDVTKWVKRGNNNIDVIVIGTLKNTLGPHHGKPALGSAWPGSFQRGPNPGPPPGDNYSTVGYGLFKPFGLKANPR
ncbi:MAG: hypothetical protein HY298_19690 [Verrucomicrobia bacterium]|nr:hypothetical protein [Verrucomicrobiota bacterium]